MGSSPMKHVATVGRFRLYYATRERFAYPGLHLWIGGSRFGDPGRGHVRVLPLPRR